MREGFRLPGKGAIHMHDQDAVVCLNAITQLAGYATALRDINVIVVCPQPGMDNVLRNIREWCHKTGSHFSKTVVTKNLSLPSAFSAMRQHPDGSILIAIGYKDSEVYQELSEAERHNLEIIIRPPRPSPSPELDEFPTASLLDNTFMINVQNTIPALRKSLLRMQLKNRVSIRRLESKEDFQQYFRLRYKVWKQMGYLPTHRDCLQSQIELDFTDRTALPIGAFMADGTLIGCARLVFPLGQEVHYVSLIRELVVEQGSTLLLENLKYPERLIHPFDLLESFKGFWEYYARLVRQGARKAEVSRVIVAPEQRNHGLGEVLVDSLISIAYQHHLQVLFLACHRRHRGFYERCGFRVLDGLECERFSGVNALAIAMACKLSDTLHIALTL